MGEIAVLVVGNSEHGGAGVGGRQPNSGEARRSSVEGTDGR